MWIVYFKYSWEFKDTFLFQGMDYGFVMYSIHFYICIQVIVVLIRSVLFDWRLEGFAS